jgi:hypothetical protein
MKDLKDERMGVDGVDRFAGQRLLHDASRAYGDGVCQQS